ncbi:large conductance mechanosensitive channel protein MscL [Adhaeribacter radiodurans]|uniref:hypothetical protein n=1 Tax=Adhaeribacter radiodurans TaxID=2745197 RepID=UPI001FE653EF|nr:hypothetical protein [Adhaeribacter radiodurans]
MLTYITLLLVKGLNSLIHKELRFLLYPTPTKKELLLAEMRDILKQIAVKYVFVADIINSYTCGKYLL